MSDINISAIKEWPVLSPIKVFIENKCIKIRLIYVFGLMREDVMYITSDDMVYAFGQNSGGVLGLGHHYVSRDPAIVAELCGKQIDCIVCNNDGTTYCFVLAITRSGQTYAWGSNQSACLGNESVSCRYKPTIITALKDITVIDICCGRYHCLALTQTGEVFAWGDNDGGECGTGDNVQQRSPIKVQNLDNIKITAIACGGHHSLAMAEHGLVYGWGYIGYEMLGIGNTINQNIPIKLGLREEIIGKKICGGYLHTLILSSSGDVYAFGNNNRGQIGDGSKTNKSTPVKIAFENKIVDILASNRHHISLALSIDNKCYVWGVNDWTAPKEVTQNNIYDAFNCNLNIKITLKPLKFILESSPDLKTRISQSFNNENYSDIKFLVERKHIYVQKLYLKSVSNYFDRMFSNDWRENSTNEIPITQYSYSVYHSFLKYLYTNKVEIETEEAVDLLDLANSYLEEELKEECVKIIKTNVSIENVCQIFSASLKHNCEELADYCAYFASNKLNEICKTESFKLIDSVDLVKQLWLKIFK